MRIHKVSLPFPNLWQELIFGRKLQNKEKYYYCETESKTTRMETLWTLPRLLVKMCDAINNPDVKM